ncbi:hypothetical protein P8C59_006086 [Phyllachora maydis]|uniref:Clr5 domain-containing protein n=1 Tax=Phyllachora maydis TaxID=1825666 RepID=A0AAD9I6U6_9PEZI|nr:hypothetical protein P8C59_006086 [Phyllachora maydis]
MTAESAGDAAASASASRKWATEEDWDKHRESITHMYSNENRTLPKLMEFMEQEHNFRATPKMYKSRFKRWGLWKYNKVADVAEIIRHQKEGKLAELPEPLAVRSKTLDIQKAEKYVKRRMRHHHARFPWANFRYLRAPDELENEEHTYRVVLDYIDSSFLRNMWTERSMSPSSPSGSETTGEAGSDGGSRLVLKASVHETRSQVQDLSARFKMGINLLTGETGSPASPAEGIKEMRIAFAMLPAVLSAEDPLLLQYVLDAVIRLREAGLGFLEAELLRHLHGLAVTLNGGHSRGEQPHATMLIWKMLRGGRPIERYHLSRCTEITVGQFERHLGAFHPQTVELIMWWVHTRSTSHREREAGWQQLWHSLAAATGPAAFDGRHMDVIMNLANLYRKGTGEMDKAWATLDIVFEDPAKLAIVRASRETAQQFYWLRGKVLQQQGRLAEAEALFRVALELCLSLKLNRAGAERISCLLALAQCLREQEKTEEADDVDLTRQALIREELERHGEKEDAV